MQRLQTEIDDFGCATLRLNNPDQHNAFDDELMTEITTALNRLGANSQVRVVILTAAGKSFSAGADLNRMRQMADDSLEENLQDALGVAGMMKALHDLPQPSIALVQGAAFGGGVGLVSACDIAIASERASFCLSEVKLGLIPAVISPYVIAAIGERAARRYFLTAERFFAAEALRIGLVHEVVSAAELEQTGAALARQLLQNGPRALTATKQLIRKVAGRPINAELVEMTAGMFAEIRASAEGREGINAFLHKRKPDWTGDQ
jgi:methylglutaconyl-CoA hydratase